MVMKNHIAVTIKDIAKSAGVSHTTVSRALADSPLINAETKTRIQAISNEMGYSTNYTARSLVRGKSNLFGLILPSLRNPFMAELSHQIEKFARSEQYDILICNSNELPDQEEQKLRLLLGRQVDGIIVFPVASETDERLSRLAPPNVPILFLNEPTDNAPGNHIATNNFNGGVLGTEYLYSLGHRNILYFGPKPCRTSQVRRQDGFITSCSQLGIIPNLYYEIVEQQQRTSLFDSAMGDLNLGCEMATNLFRQNKHKDFSAFFARTDMMALGIIKAANECGIDIPGDISLIGYDDISYASLPGINLTTIRQPSCEMAKQGVEGLVSIISGKCDTEFRRYLNPELIVRNTCKSLKE